VSNSEVTSSYVVSSYQGDKDSKRDNEGFRLLGVCS